MKPTKLHHGRQNVTLWMKPEHVARLDELANGGDRSTFILYLVSAGLHHLSEEELSADIQSDAIDRHPGARTDLAR